MMRVGTTGACVVVLFITATFVEIVDMVVDVVVLDKAGRPAVVPAKAKMMQSVNHHFLSLCKHCRQ